eukprot:CAMPEP_0174264124 /NCGR_PEP_ID=MMETSP0439-20130205/21398_1 /TAXON_ID=0 /ORGANISM="Stereomyxa ramosa, Strain Chinc5" /LENGTH=470 /DNA_ID=CAMNT_0015349851 /DNA_START=163 /DNA_END=1572 /DNA_ORIENTATION=-
MIPITSSTIDNLGIYAKDLSGLLMVEGDDVNPMYYTAMEETIHLSKPGVMIKDVLEFRLANWAIRNELPILGICRGMQLLNVACKGTLYADVRKELPSDIPHIQGDYDTSFRHKISVVPNTPLHHWFQTHSLNVNSYHHQGVRSLAPIFRPMAFSEDGLCEGFYNPNHPFMVGLQFHPERMLDEYAGKCYLVHQHFIEACRNKAVDQEKRKELEAEKDNKSHFKTPFVSLGKFPFSFQVTSVNEDQAIRDLCFFASQGNIFALKKLIEGDGAIKVDVDAFDYDKRTALHLAAAQGHDEVAKYLIHRAGAFVNPLDRWNNTPLDEAVREGHKTTVKILREAGARPTKPSYTSDLCTSAFMGDLDTIRNLVSAGVSVNVYDYNKKTPLHLAASQGHKDIVEYLLGQGAYVHVKDIWGQTPLTEAMRQKHDHVTEILARYGEGYGSGSSFGPSQPNPHTQVFMSSHDKLVLNS